jgi:hypothetical protein
MNKLRIVRNMACIILMHCAQENVQGLPVWEETSSSDRQLALTAARNSKLLSILSGAEEVVLQNGQTWLLGVGHAPLNASARRSDAVKQQRLRVAQANAAANIVKMRGSQVTSTSQLITRFKASDDRKGEKASFETEFSERARVHASGFVSGLCDLGVWESSDFLYVAVGTRIR